MNWMTYTVDLARALAWPAVVGIAAWRVGPSIGEMLRDRQWKASGFGMAVEAGDAVTRQTEQLEESVAEVVEPSTPPSPTDRSPRFNATVEQLADIMQDALELGFKAAGGTGKPPVVVVTTDEDGHARISVEAPSVEMDQLLRRRAAALRRINKDWPDPRR